MTSYGLFILTTKSAARFLRRLNLSVMHLFCGGLRTHPTLIKIEKHFTNSTWPLSRERRGDNRQPCKCEGTFFAFDVNSSCDETPSADPHARGGVGRAGETRPYPIIRRISVRAIN